VAGRAHSCGLKPDGTLACWGDNGYGQVTAPSGPFTQLSAGDDHACGRKTDGTLACWGDDRYGQATAPAGLFLQVEAGGAHTCAMRIDGTVTCWGDARAGRVKDLHVLAPNGGEVWAVGSPQTIRWTSTGVSGNVRIRLSCDGGLTWTTLIESTPNDGQERWTVTGPATAQARIRVRSVELAAVSDSSEANLIIQ
jgi:hypothetical protein